MTGKAGVKVQFLFFPGCPNHRDAWRELTELLSDKEMEATIERTIVQTDEDAKKLAFLGSPTLKVNGVDVEPSARKRTDFGMTCRVYRVNGRLLGSPSRAMMEKALLAPKAAGLSRHQDAIFEGSKG